MRVPARLTVLILAAATASSLTLAGCGSATPAATDTPAATATPTPTDTPTPTATEAPSASFTPWPSASPTPEATPPPTPGPAVTPTPGPTSPAQFCSGNDSNRTFFLQAAHGSKFTVYCATGLPTGWAISGGTWSGGASGAVKVTYKYKKTSEQFVVQEGAFCLGDPVTCVGGPHPPAGSGTTNFDGMSGEFLAITGGLLIAVDPGTTKAYMITATNVPLGTLVTFAANMKAVPKA